MLDRRHVVRNLLTLEHHDGGARVPDPLHAQCCRFLEFAMFCSISCRVCSTGIPLFTPFMVPCGVVRYTPTSCSLPSIKMNYMWSFVLGRLSLGVLPTTMFCCRFGQNKSAANLRPWHLRHRHYGRRHGLIFAMIRAPGGTPRSWWPPVVKRRASWPPSLPKPSHIWHTLLQILADDRRVPWPRLGPYAESLHLDSSGIIPSPATSSSNRIRLNLEKISPCRAPYK